MMALQVSMENIVVEFHCRLDELVVILFGLIYEVVRNFDVAETRAKRILIPDDTLHANEVDNSFK